MTKRYWLSMRPVQIRIGGYPATLPVDCVGLFGAFKTKKAARAVCGKDVELMEAVLTYLKQTKEEEKR